jgi:hypothetical protein
MAGELVGEEITFVCVSTLSEDRVVGEATVVIEGFLVAAANKAKSELCHHTGNPSP